MARKLRRRQRPRLRATVRDPRRSRRDRAGQGDGRTWQTVERIAVTIRDTPAAGIKGVAVKLLAMEILCKGYEMAMLGEGRGKVDRAAADYDLEQMMIFVDQVLELAASEQRSAH